jgi:hypothetical protein
MKQLITIIAAVAALTSVNLQAELNSKQFVQLRNWAESRGFFYKGIVSKFDVQCFEFTNAGPKVFGWVPISSDTADEAINALIASTITFQEVANMSKIIATDTPTAVAQVAQPVVEEVEAVDATTSAKLIKATWDKTFGVAVWRVTIKNTSNKTIGNIKFRTVYASETGITVDKGGVDGITGKDGILKKILPGQTRTFEDVNDGFCNSDADKATFEIVEAEFIES